MKITFKDVGQGDSIIIEWKDGDGIDKIGIIDCKLKGRKNPVLDYLKTKPYKEIAFLVLSHPHADHYSGYLELLNYIEQSNIPILRMCHTVGFNGVESYWKYFEVNSTATTLLTEIKKKWAFLREKDLIKRMDFLFDGKTMKIDNHVTIVCLSPSHAEISEYQSKVKFDEIKNEKDASSAANLLSTLLRLTYNDKYDCLLTSDLEIFAFNGALQRESHHLTGVKFHICQMAHHGSAKNYDPSFWKEIKTFEIQNAIASAGQGYRHPSYKVLKSFYDSGYKVYCTNIVNGMVDFVKMIEKKSKKIDSFSEIAEEYIKANDRIFEIKEENIILL